MGIGVQAFLVWVIIGYVMPWLGADLLGMARDVADFNLPARVGQLFGRAGVPSSGVDISLTAGR